MQQNAVNKITDWPAHHARLLEKVAVLCHQSSNKVTAISDGLAKALLNGGDVRIGREKKVGVSRYGAIWIQYWAGVYYAECLQYNGCPNAPVSEANVAVIYRQYPDVCHIVEPNGADVTTPDSLIRPKDFCLIDAIDYCREQGWDYIIN